MKFNKNSEKYKKTPESRKIQKIMRTWVFVMVDGFFATTAHLSLLTLYRVL